MRVGELSANGWRFERPYSGVFPVSLAYSASGRLAYIAYETGSQFAVLDGEAQTESWEAVSDELGWSSDGQRYSFVGKRGSEEFVVAPENNWKIMGRPLPHRFVQNRDGSQIAWLTQSNHQQLFINGELHWEAPQFIENPVWSPDGKRLAFAYADQGGVTIRIGEREFGPYPSL